jgi:glycerol uptake facilitator-like aquaporin
MVKNEFIDKLLVFIIGIVIGFLLAFLILASMYKKAVNDVEKDQEHMCSCSCCCKEKGET